MRVIVVFGTIGAAMIAISALSFFLIRPYALAFLASPSIIGVFFFILFSDPMNKFGPIIPTVIPVLLACALSAIVGKIMYENGWAAGSKK